MSQATFNTLLGVALAALFASIGFAIRRQITAGEANREALAEMRDSFANELRNVSVTLAELNTGASAGARAAISDLRAELRQGLRDVTRDVAHLRTEHDNLAERHANLNGTAVQLAERVNGTRELLFEVRREMAAATAAALRSVATAGGTS